VTVTVQCAAGGVQLMEAGAVSPRSFSLAKDGSVLSGSPMGSDAGEREKPKDELPFICIAWSATLQILRDALPPACIHTGHAFAGLSQVHRRSQPQVHDSFQPPLSPPFLLAHKPSNAAPSRARPQVRGVHRGAPRCTAGTWWTPPLPRLLNGGQGRERTEARVQRGRPRVRARRLCLSWPWFTQEDGAVRATFQRDGSEVSVTSGLLVGSDGIRSEVRRALFGIEQPGAHRRPQAHAVARDGGL